MIQHCWSNIDMLICQPCFNIDISTQFQHQYMDLIQHWNFNVDSMFIFQHHFNIQFMDPIQHWSINVDSMLTFFSCLIFQIQLLTKCWYNVDDQPLTCWFVNIVSILIQHWFARWAGIQQMNERSSGVDVLMLMNQPEFSVD